MSIDWTSPGISAAVAALLTPIVVLAWSRAFPVKDDNEFFDVDVQTLKRKYGWVDGIATLMMFIGCITPIFFHRQLANEGMWIVGLSFGLMVIFHFAWVCIATLPFGYYRFREFWRFYELRWGIGITGIKVVYIPIGTLGIISAVMIWL